MSTLVLILTGGRETVLKAGNATLISSYFLKVILNLNLNLNLFIYF